MLSERPVVLTNVGNISDFLEDNQSAFIAEPGDIYGISDKMIEVSSNPMKADTIAKNGKKVAIKEFNSSIETAKLLKCLYN